MREKGAEFMKKGILFLFLALLIVGNLAALTWGGVDPSRLLINVQCSPN
jgi:hypothetical protein